MHRHPYQARRLAHVAIVRFFTPVMLTLATALTVPLATKAQTTTELPPKRAAQSDANAAVQPSPSAASAAPATTRQVSKPKPSVAAFDPSNTVHIVYTHPQWNKDARTFDTGTIVMRDTTTGRLVTLALVETEPDSGQFAGVYSINWQNLERVKIEFYSLPESLDSSEEPPDLTSLMEQHVLKQRPFILRRAETGIQYVEIFDTREQARAALKSLRPAQLTIVQNRKVMFFPTTQTLDMDRLTESLEKQTDYDALETKRFQVLSEEEKFINELKAKNARLSRAEREQNKKLALAAAAAGQAAFAANDFINAKLQFEKARELDPDNRVFYFQYGVTLYKLDDFTRSLVLLGLAEGKGVNLNEKAYFTGLNYYRLKEFDQSVAEFDKVVASLDPTLTPSGQFYRGLAFFDQKKWDEAQKSFQVVLDSSRDPNLDARTESYIEQILRIRQFEAERAKKWTVSLTLGESYDSDVLTINDSSDSGSATNAAGYRTLLTGSLHYRPIYEADHEFAADLTVVDMYTINQADQYSQTLRNSDPTVTTLILPYSFKGTLLGKANKFDIVPGYESIWMSVEDNTDKQILYSGLLNFYDLMIMNERWYSTVALELRNDTSLLNSSTGDNNSSAIKAKLGTTQMFLVSPDKTHVVTANGAYTLNEAAGKSITYNRIDLGVGFIRPLPIWSLSTNFKFDYYLLTYPENTTGRIDNDYTFTAGLSRKVDDVWNAGLLMTYCANNSNVSTYEYNKWTAMLTLSASLGL